VLNVTTFTSLTLFAVARKARISRRAMRLARSMGKP